MNQLQQQFHNSSCIYIIFSKLKINGTGLVILYNGNQIDGSLTPECIYK